MDGLRTINGPCYDCGGDGFVETMTGKLKKPCTECDATGERSYEYGCDNEIIEDMQNAHDTRI